jgi:predicted nuclease with TOPRIM domain
MPASPASPGALINQLRAQVGALQAQLDAQSGSLQSLAAVQAQLEEARSALGKVERLAGARYEQLVAAEELAANRRKECDALQAGACVRGWVRGAAD